MQFSSTHTHPMVLDTSTRCEWPPKELVPVRVATQKPLHCIELCSTLTGSYVKLDAATDITLGISCLSVSAYASWLESREQYDGLNEFAALKMALALDQEKKAYARHASHNAQTEYTTGKESVQRHLMESYAPTMGDPANDMLKSIEQDAIANDVESPFFMEKDVVAQLHEPPSVSPVAVHSLWMERVRQSDVESKHGNTKSPVSILQSTL